MEYFTFTNASKGNVKFERDNKRVSVSGVCEFGNVFGNNILSMNENMIYNYTFRINDISDTVYLGIINQDSINLLNGYQPFTYNGYGFALRDDGNLYSPQSTINDDNDPYYLEKAVNGEFKTGDIIKMRLDTVNKKLIFNINNNDDITINMNDSSNDDKYRIAAYLYASEENEEEEESAITLCSYSLNKGGHKQEGQHQNVNEETLEIIIRNKDKQIQELKETNHRQQELIAFLKGETHYNHDFVSESPPKEQNEGQEVTSSTCNEEYVYNISSLNGEKEEQNQEKENAQKD